MKKLIAVVLLGLGAAQVAFAAENNTYTEAPFAAREFVAPETAVEGIRSYDLVDRYNP
jgi:hypothetical protein